MCALYGVRYNFGVESLFVIELIYTASLARIDAAMPAHVRFLKKHYASGNFVVSGRKIPRDGGIIIASGESKEQLEAIMREDPFVSGGLADVRVLEFRVSQRAADAEIRRLFAGGRGSGAF